MRRAIRLSFLAAYIAGLLFVTLAPLPSDAYRVTRVAGLDKIVHFGLFGGLALLWAWAWVGSDWGRPRTIVTIATVFAGLVELFQGPLPFRTGDVWDFVWGGAGIAVAFGLVLLLQARPAR